LTENNGKFYKQPWKLRRDFATKEQNLPKRSGLEWSVCQSEGFFRILWKT